MLLQKHSDAQRQKVERALAGLKAASSHAMRMNVHFHPQRLGWFTRGAKYCMALGLALKAAGAERKNTLEKLQGAPPRKSMLRCGGAV